MGRWVGRWVVGCSVGEKEVVFPGGCSSRERVAGRADCRGETKPAGAEDVACFLAGTAEKLLVDVGGQVGLLGSTRLCTPSGSCVAPPGPAAGETLSRVDVGRLWGVGDQVRRRHGRRGRKLCSTDRRKRHSPLPLAAQHQSDDSETGGPTGPSGLGSSTRDRWICRSTPVLYTMMFIQPDLDGDDGV